MIYKRKSKMKTNRVYSLLIALCSVLLLFGTANCQPASDGQPRPNAVEDDPSDLLPSGVDLEALKFIDRPVLATDPNGDNQYINLVSSNSQAALPLLASNEPNDHLKGEGYDQLPSIELENVYTNDLTKAKTPKIYTNDLNGQSFANFFPESDPATFLKDLKQILPTLDLDSARTDSKTDSNRPTENRSNPRSADRANHQSPTQNIKLIKQLDSKVNLTEVLVQLNLLIDPNMPASPQARNIKKIQRRLVKSNPGVLSALDKGFKLSLSECKFQFKNHYWNCPIDRKAKGKQIFGKILDRACRETAYLTSIRSAGLVYAITKACSEGLIRTCTCDSRQNTNYISDQPGQSLFTADSQYVSVLSSESYANELALRLGIDGIGGNAVQLNSNGNQEYTSDFKWSGCSDNIRFAFRKAKELLDWHLKGSPKVDHKVLVHNYEAGRQAVKENMILVCKCHGLSGTCTMRTCWRRLSSFRRVGSYLKDRYQSAIQVIPSNDGQSLVPKEENISPPTGLDLFYSEESPDFCTRDLEKGSLGTAGRQCDPNTVGNSNSCDQLCCGRGYQVKRRIVKYRCDCEFQWCCEIKCNICKKIVQVYECV